MSGIGFYADRSQTCRSNANQLYQDVTFEQSVILKHIEDSVWVALSKDDATDCETSYAHHTSYGYSDRMGVIPKFPPKVSLALLQHVNPATASLLLAHLSDAESLPEDMTLQFTPIVGMRRTRLILHTAGVYLTTKPESMNDSLRDQLTNLLQQGLVVFVSPASYSFGARFKKSSHSDGLFQLTISDRALDAVGNLKEPKERKPRLSKPIRITKKEYANTREPVYKWDVIKFLNSLHRYITKGRRADFGSSAHLSTAAKYTLKYLYAVEVNHGVKSYRHTAAYREFMLDVARNPADSIKKLEAECQDFANWVHRELLSSCGKMLIRLADAKIAANTHKASDTQLRQVSLLESQFKKLYNETKLKNRKAGINTEAVPAGLSLVVKAEKLATAKEAKLREAEKARRKKVRKADKAMTKKLVSTIKKAQGKTDDRQTAITETNTEGQTAAKAEITQLSESAQVDFLLAAIDSEERG